MGKAKVRTGPDFAPPLGSATESWREWPTCQVVTPGLVKRNSQRVLTTPGDHMSTSPDGIRSSARDAQPARSVLHMEMQASERWLLTLFASSFLEWIKDESASFARDV